MNFTVSKRRGELLSVIPKFYGCGAHINKKFLELRNAAALRLDERKIAEIPKRLRADVEAQRPVGCPPVLGELISHLKRIKVARLAHALAGELELSWVDLAREHRFDTMHALTGQATLIANP